MDRWQGKVAVITGASVGIGEALVKSLANYGMIAVGLARSEEKLRKIASESNGKIHGIKCDMTCEKNIIEAFKEIEELFGGVDVLINNAGYLNVSSMIDGSVDSWKQILETNVLGLSICTKEALKTMRSRGDNGHIIHINSVLGHSIPHFMTGSIGMYPASKYAVSALTEIHRNELRNSGSSIKITSISPGLVYTQMGVCVAAHVFKADKNDQLPETPIGYLSSQDVADTVIVALSVKPHVEIQELTLQCNSYVRN